MSYYNIRTNLEFKLELWHDGEQQGGVDAVQLKDKLIEMVPDLALRGGTHHQGIVEDLGREGGENCVRHVMHTYYTTLMVLRIQSGFCQSNINYNSTTTHARTHAHTHTHTQTSH